MTPESHHISPKPPLWDFLWLDHNYKGFFFLFVCFSRKVQFSLRCHSSCFASRGLSPCLGEQSSQLSVLLNYPWLDNYLPDWQLSKCISHSIGQWHQKIVGHQPDGKLQLAWLSNGSDAGHLTSKRLQIPAFDPLFVKSSLSTWSTE